MSDSEKEDNDEEVVDETKEEEKEEEEAEESIEFNYEQWLEELKAVQSGRDFLLHLDRLPKTKKRYGRTQMYGILWNFVSCTYHVLCHERNRFQYQSFLRMYCVNEC